MPSINDNNNPNTPQTSTNTQTMPQAPVRSVSLNNTARNAPSFPITLDQVNAQAGSRECLSGSLFGKN